MVIAVMANAVAAENPAIEPSMNEDAASATSPTSPAESRPLPEHDAGHKCRTDGLARHASEGAGNFGKSSDDPQGPAHCDAHDGRVVGHIPLALGKAKPERQEGQNPQRR